MIEPLVCHELDRLLLVEPVTLGGIEELTVYADDTEHEVLGFEEMFCDNPILTDTDLTVVPNESEFVIVHENLLQEKIGEEK